MMTNFDDVGEFHDRFGLPRAHQAYIRGHLVNSAGVGPRPWDEELINFRVKFLREELDEFVLGAAERDHAQTADALIDLVYVAMGTAHLLGYPWEELWDEVQRANMTKQRAAKDGSDSVRGSAWDVVKPPGWQPPAIAAVLARAGFDT